MWVQLTLRVPEEQLEAIESTLTGLGAQSISLSSAADETVVEPPLGTLPMWSQVGVVALFSADCDYGAIRHTFRREFDDVQLLDVDFLGDQDWSTTWREGWTSKRFGNLVVAPFHEQAEAGTVTVHLDPGLAFGTGHHPSTALCLRWIVSSMPRRARVLDFGCGSGILSIAAKKLGAETVMGIDRDPQAVCATMENARANDVEIECRENLSSAASFDVVIANILSQTLIELSSLLSDSVAQDGWIVLSGLLIDQVTGVQRAYPDFEFCPLLTEEGWALVAGQKQVDRYRGSN